MTNGANNHPRTREQRAELRRALGLAVVFLVVVLLVAYVWSGW